MLIERAQVPDIAMTLFNYNRFLSGQKVLHDLPSEGTISSQQRTGQTDATQFAESRNQLRYHGHRKSSAISYL